MNFIHVSMYLADANWGHIQLQDVVHMSLTLILS